jgi:hypothetical protein
VCATSTFNATHHTNNGAKTARHANRLLFFLANTCLKKTSNNLFGCFLKAQKKATPAHAGVAKESSIQNRHLMLPKKKK